MPALRERARARAGERANLRRAVRASRTAGGRTDIAAWVAAVERCATRAAYLLASDLTVATAILRAEPRVVVSSRTKSPIG